MGRKLNLLSVDTITELGKELCR